MYVKLTAQESLDIENGLLWDMARRFARLIENSTENTTMESAKPAESKEPETVRIMMTVDGIASHQRKGLVLDAHIDVGQDDKPIYWIHWAGNALAVDESECVRLDGRGQPISK